MALDSAVRAFWLNGFEGTDVGRIAESLGATKPSVYRAFGDKESLFLKALRHYLETFGYAPVRAMQEADEIHDALAAFLRVAIENYTRDGEPRGCMMGSIATAEAEAHPDAGKLYRAAIAACDDVVAKRLERAVTDGQLPKGFPVYERSRLFVNLVGGISLRARTGASRTSLRGTIGESVNCVLAE